MIVLVDTSVWIEFFRGNCANLKSLLVTDSVATHPFIIGELACGTPPNRMQTLRDISNLTLSIQPTQNEVLEFINRNKLFGLGCGLIDLTLLASVLLTDECKLWTLDKHLALQANKLNVLYDT
ncbi:VapC toxin family PIN domain ribonuclease [Alteromonas oceanisediminis]|uniref:VapC toxin family PIN domain ribonuclease n=1 Tax=Alteromonas oceanisediminis TaxID=2836180 RepID=UPI001BDA1143|nr:VapC toxin family PIN domain ribonuclease [Alteromonas oceanisediminis]MBT0585760.1 VapC toxin family PIN domain ribonuclease [Alteromonas oceanisediminis]